MRAPGSTAATNVAVVVLVPIHFLSACDSGDVHIVLLTYLLTYLFVDITPAALARR